MAPQTHELLIDADLIGVDRDLFCDPVLVDTGIPQEIMNFCGEFFLIRAHNFRRALGDVVDTSRHHIEFFLNIRGEKHALAGSRLSDGLSRFVDRILQKRPELAYIPLVQVFDRKNICHPGKIGNPDVVLKTELRAHILHIPDIFLCKRMIIFYLLVRIGEIFQCDEKIHLAALNVYFYLIADLRLQRIQFPRHFDGKIKKTVIHRLDLCDDFLIFFGYFAPAIAGHASHHLETPSLYP